MEPSREMSSSQCYLARDVARSALGNDHSVMNNRFTGKLCLALALIIIQLLKVLTNNVGSGFVLRRF